MKLFDEHIDYGIGMYRYAVWIVVGFITAVAGPTAFNIALASLGGIGGPAVQQLILLLGTVLSQFAGAIIAGTGFFGALHKIMEDTR